MTDWKNRDTDSNQEEKKAEKVRLTFFLNTGGYYKYPLLMPWAYISRSSKIGPTWGHIICSTKCSKKL